MLLTIIWWLGGVMATPAPTLQNDSARGFLCETAPPNAQPADALFRLKISGDPKHFIPGGRYIVNIEGVKTAGSKLRQFTGFELWAEPVNQILSNVTTEFSSTELSLGTLQPYDNLTKAHDVCKDAVNNATSQVKTHVQIIWNAPLQATNSCVRLSARIMPRIRAIKRKKSKITRSSVLAYKLCPTAIPSNFSNNSPKIQDHCCICEEAKYKVEFESMWSENFHLHELPPASARKDEQFSNFIGASHAASFKLWQEGKLASFGVKSIAESGSTIDLEKELKAKADYIRTIIKAKGITWQQFRVSDKPSSFAMFRVDPFNHLLSILSKMSPSPDWIVGVSAFELCSTNCTWIASATIPLYPYDAGINDGINFLSPRQPTIPATPVRVLTPNWPNDTRSPFYRTTGAMRPFAKLHVTRLQLFERSCDDSKLNETGTLIDGSEDSGSACATGPWGLWSPCSVTCGLGRKVRRRYYLRPGIAREPICQSKLIEDVACVGSIPQCRPVSDYELDATLSTGPCAMSPWSEWAKCEGCGIRTRIRHYLVQGMQKHCDLAFRTRVPLIQIMPCEQGLCSKPTIDKNQTDIDYNYADLPGGPCEVTPWDDWSPCSASCGRGYRMRTRLYVSTDERVQSELTRRLMHSWNRAFAELQNLETSYQNTSATDPEVEAMVEEQLKNCRNTMSVEVNLCDADSTICTQIRTPMDVCKQPLDVGHCRAYYERWFYDHSLGRCEPFGYTGCGGNENNFPNLSQCENFCMLST
ncbi:hypothetical protein ACJJTC_017851 [Scirpophaga incertulas]